ncbi:uncharacterized protein LOC130896794 [Diorhabda carinulata]|uniref:uncharacterized protein LOC130896794 n=1 Tax=Diorhabda carinulata TaxID=1163345 RepID=UPI0025A17DB3|nr:uncharacterized protein LOC130896794 [Diorhabda carinulata]
MYPFCNCHFSDSSASASDSEDTFRQEIQIYDCRECKKKQKKLAKGKFGLAYVIETPKEIITKPIGWQVEFNDTPSKIQNNCETMLKWVNRPPLGECTTVTDYPKECGEFLKRNKRYKKAVCSCKPVLCEKCDINTRRLPICYCDNSIKKCGNCFPENLVRNCQCCRKEERNGDLDYIPKKEKNKTKITQTRNKKREEPPKEEGKEDKEVVHKIEAKAVVDIRFSDKGVEIKKVETETTSPVSQQPKADKKIQSSPDVKTVGNLQKELAEKFAERRAKTEEKKKSEESDTEVSKEEVVSTSPLLQ